MPGVAKGLPAGEAPRTQIQADERVELGDSNNCEMRRSTTANPSDLLTREPHHSAQRRVAQPTIEPRFLELAAELLNEASTSRRSAVERARSQGHA